MKKLGGIVVYRAFLILAVALSMFTQVSSAEEGTGIAAEIPALSELTDLGVLEYRSAADPTVVAGRIPLTANDVLWMARMLRGEAYGFGTTHYAMILYTVAQRLWYLPAYRTVGTFTEFMRAFSQPINPRFIDVNSPYCDRYRAQCSPSYIRRRLLIQNMAWEDIPAELRTMAIEFAHGRVANPVPLSIDFARAYGPRDCINKGTRVLLHDPLTARPNHVFCRPMSDSRAPLFQVVTE